MRNEKRGQTNLLSLIIANLLASLFGLNGTGNLLFRNP